MLIYEAQSSLHDVYAVIAKAGNSYDRSNVEALVKKRFPGNSQKVELTKALHMSAGQAQQNAVRAVVLLQILLKGLDPANDAALISTLWSNWQHKSQQDCQNKVAKLLQRLRPQAPSLPSGSPAKQIVPTKTTKDAVLAPSFDRANSLEKELAKKAFEQASELLTRASQQAQLASSPRNTRQRDAFELYFGTFDATRHARVLAVLKAVHDELVGKAIHLYYRGAKVTGRQDDRPNAAPGTTVTASETFAYVQKPPPGPGTHVFLGKQFFSDAKVNGGTDSIGGVVIHELSHALANTHDKKHPTRFQTGPGKRNFRRDPLTHAMVKVAPGTGQYSRQTVYGMTLAQELATLAPEKAVENADNYEYYCEQFKQ